MDFVFYFIYFSSFGLFLSDMYYEWTTYIDSKCAGYGRHVGYQYIFIATHWKIDMIYVSTYSSYASRSTKKAYAAESSMFLAMQHCSRRERKSKREC